MTEASIRNGRAPSEVSESGSGGQISTGDVLLRGKQMVLTESEEHAVQYNDWLKKKKAAKSRLTITIESTNSEFSREEASTMVYMYVALI